jgi:hypothetical protein
MDSEDIHVCQFISSAGETCIPANIATGLAKYTDVNSSIITWFDDDAFEGQEFVDIHSIDASEVF